MAETVIYNGETYTRMNSKWVDKNYMVVTHLQGVLDRLLSSQKSTDDLSVEELIAEADKFKEAGSFSCAIDYYEKALNTRTVEVHRFVLPKLTSCYRARGQAAKAIELF